MKKKIKDLTLEEQYKLCSKYNCPECPLSCFCPAFVKEFYKKYRNKEIDL